MGTYFFKKIRNPYIGLCLVAITVCCLYLYLVPLKIENCYLTNAAGQTSPISLPFQQVMPAGAEFIISGTIRYQPLLNSTVAWIIPDDGVTEIRVNGREVPLTGVSAGALFDCNNGFHYNLDDYLHPGENQITIRIKNNGGLAGLSFKQSLQNKKLMIAYSFLFIIILILIYLTFPGTAVNKRFVLILTGGFLIRLLYFMYTGFAVRSHDVGGHLQYIEYLANNCTIPAIHYGWQTYQPPLYYIFAAFIYSLMVLAGVDQPMQIWRGIQFFSLLLYMGFLGATLQIIRLAIAKLPGGPGDVRKTSGGKGDPWSWVVCLSFALVTFWPSGIIHSLRIGNDGMFYLFYALGLLYLIKWYDDDRLINGYLSFLFTTLAFITKANALVLYLVFGIVYLLKFIKARKKRKLAMQVAILTGIFLVGFGITFGRMVEQRLNGSHDNFIVANASGLQGVAVGNKLKNYIAFDLQSFVTEPYVNPFADQGGRQFFWNYLFKTGLIGEFGYDNPFHRSLTIILSILFLLMLYYTLVSLITFSEHLKGQLVSGLNAICLLAAAIAFRISIPAACSNDFRYILPIIISFGIFYGAGIWCYHQQKLRWLEFIGYGLACIFIVTSITFFIALGFSPV